MLAFYIPVCCKPIKFLMVCLFLFNYKTFLIAYCTANFSLNCPQKRKKGLQNNSNSYLHIPFVKA